MTSADQRHQRAESLLAQLQRDHEVLRHYRPLDESSIEMELLAAHPDVEPWLIRSALRLHLATDAYLQSLSHGGKRLRLDGGATEPVEPEVRHHARALLRHHHRHKGEA
jgi:ProQ/FINO family